MGLDKSRDQFNNNLPETWSMVFAEAMRLGRQLVLLVRVGFQRWGTASTIQ